MEQKYVAASKDIIANTAHTQHVNTARNTHNTYIEVIKRK